MLKPSKNPFLKTQINSAFEISPDVEGIHEALTNRLLSTISQVKSQGSILQILIGAPGSGKTHLLSRLWKLSSKGIEDSFLFVAIPPPGNLTRINLHILREIISSLLEGYKADNDKESSTLLPLDLFITEILRKILIETLTDENIKETIKSSQSEALYNLLTKSENRSVFIKHSLANFQKVFPSIEITLIQALFALLDPFRKFYILKWFQGGELTDSERDTLNLGVKYIDESLALVLSKAIISLSPFPILLTVDQLESSFYRFKKEGLIRLVDNVIALLQEQNNLFLLLVVQTQEWIDNIRNSLPKYIVDRVSKLHPIKPLTLKEASALAKLRLEKFHLTTETIFLQQKIYYPFSTDFIANTYKSSGGNPRQFLNLLRESFEYSDDVMFNPNWEKEYKSNLEVTEETKVESTDIIDFYDEILEKETMKQSELLESVPMEKLSEIIKGTIFQLVSECYNIGFLEKISEESIKLNFNQGNLLIDILITDPKFGYDWIGIIITNQKNLNQFHQILETILTIPSSQKIIIIRSNRLENMDVTPKISNAKSKISLSSNLEFIYLPDNLETEFLVSKHLNDNSKDYTRKGIKTTPELILWYLIKKFIERNPIYSLLFSQELIFRIKSRTEMRIKRVAYLDNINITKKIKSIQNQIKLQDFTIVSISGGDGVEFGLIFSYYIEDNLNWGLFKGSGLIHLSSYIKEFIKQKQLKWDVLGIFVHSGPSNITQLIDQPINTVIAEYGHGVHLSLTESIESIELNVLGLMSYLTTIFGLIPSGTSITPEKLKSKAEIEEVPTLLIGTIAQLIGPLLNVTFRNGQIYSITESSYSDHVETVRERSIIEGIEKSYEHLEKELDPLDIAEQKGEIQRIWDDNVIELSNRLSKFNLYIDPQDYEILTAVLNYAKISPSSLTPLIRGLVNEFGKNAKEFQIKLSLEDIEKEILENYKPFKDQWVKLRSMPSLISALGMNFQLMGYILNAFTLLDFHNIEIDQNWHDLISQSTKGFVKSNLTIQQLSESYYSQKFENETKQTLLPIVNKYQTLIIDETNLIEKLFPDSTSEEKTNQYITLARHISEWWLILECFNRVVGFEFHLDNKPFMDEIFDRFEAQFKNHKINYISTDPLNFTIFFDNAFELMSIDVEKLLQTHEIRSELSIIQANLYKTLLDKKYHSDPNKYFDEFSFWQMFYLSQLLDSDKSSLLASEIINNLKNFSSKSLNETMNKNILLLQIITPNIIYSSVKYLSIETIILASLVSNIFDSKLEIFESKQLFHMIDMLLLLPPNPQGEAINIQYELSDLASLFPISIPLFNKSNKKIKIAQNLKYSLSSRLSMKETIRIVDKSIELSGLSSISAKTSGNGTKIILKGETVSNNQLELEIITEKGKNGTGINFDFKWNKKSENSKQLSNVLVSTTIVLILTSEKNKVLEDKVFVTKCSLCSYQINLIKNKENNILFPCLKCGTNNIVHPNVYKLVKNFIY